MLNAACGENLTVRNLVEIVQHSRGIQWEPFYCCGTGARTTRQDSAAE